MPVKEQNLKPRLTAAELSKLNSKKVSMRHARYTPEQRSENARRLVMARWGKRTREERA